MGWMAAVGERRAGAAAQPFECVGTVVPAGADLHSAISSTSADTYCLAAGTYNIGATPLHFANGTKIVGQPVTFGPTLPAGGRTVSAPTKIVGTGSAIFEAETGDTTLTLENLDISGATGLHPGGRGINGNFEILRTLTVRNCKIHHNAVAAIGSCGEGLRVYNCEISDNGSGNGGTDAGIKTTHYAEIRDTYFFNNSTMGMWWDCDAPGGLIDNCTIDGCELDGIQVEISSGENTSPKPLPTWGSYSFDVINNYVTNANWRNQSPHAGIFIVSSMNVLVDNNTVINNQGFEIKVRTDSRGGGPNCLNPALGHSGCQSGFCTTNVVVSNNDYGPLTISTSDTTATVTGNTKIL